MSLIYATGDASKMNFALFWQKVKSKEWIEAPKYTVSKNKTQQMTAYGLVTLRGQSPSRLWICVDASQVTGRFER